MKRKDKRKVELTENLRSGYLIQKKGYLGTTTQQAFNEESVKMQERKTFPQTGSDSSHNTTNDFRNWYRYLLQAKLAGKPTNQVDYKENIWNGEEQFEKNQENEKKTKNK